MTHLHQEYVAYLKNQLDEACAMIAQRDAEIRTLKDKLLFYTAKFKPKEMNGGRPKVVKPIVNPDHFEDPNWLPMGRNA